MPAAVRGRGPGPAANFMLWRALIDCIGDELYPGAIMTKLPALQIRHSETSTANTWAVRDTWTDGAFAEISGFHNEAVANDWIISKFPTWVEEIAKARDG